MVLKLIDQFFVSLSIALIRLYQMTLSPTHGLLRNIRGDSVCTHDPDCSTYVVQVLRRYGFLRGISMGLERVSQCVPAGELNYDPPYYRVVFASGSPIGVPFLAQIANDPRFELCGVMTAPDKAVGRGMKFQANPIKTEGLKYLSEDKIITPSSLRLNSKKYSDDAYTAHQWLEDIEPDFLVVVAYGQILPIDVLEIPRIGPLNVHGSLLPEYRGASPLQAVFLDHKDESGITIMRMEAGLDTGPIIDKLITPLHFDRTVLDLISWMKDKGPKFLNKTMREFGKSRLTAITQDDSMSSHCGKILKEDGLINPYKDKLPDIYAKYRAFAMRPKIYFMDKSKRIIIEELVLDQDLYVQGSELSLFVGDVLHPAVKSLIIKPEGKKKMSRADYSRGKR